jgi:dnd system-associated protein 4
MVEMQREAYFPTFRDILLFAGAVGFRNGRRVPVGAISGDSIRYEVLVGPGFSDTLISMIAANVVSEDPEILDAARLEERVRIFEEYVNGGLEYIQEQVNVRHQPVALVVIDLVGEVLSGGGGVAPATVDELLSGVTWG